MFSLSFFIDVFASSPAYSLRHSAKISRMANGPYHKWLGIPSEALPHREAEKEGIAPNASKVFSKTTMVTNSIPHSIIG